MPDLVPELPPIMDEPSAARDAGAVPAGTDPDCVLRL
jgi:hypothetical protein